MLVMLSFNPLTFMSHIIPCFCEKVNAVALSGTEINFQGTSTEQRFEGFKRQSNIILDKGRLEQERCL